MLAAVTMLTSVLGSNVTSLPDKFQSTAAAPDPPGINSKVLQLRDGSSNTWTHFWCPVTFVSSLAITVWNAGTITFLVITTLPFTWSKSNSRSLAYDDFYIIVLIYANFQYCDSDCNSSSVIQLVTWSIIQLPTCIGTLLL